MSGLVDLIYQYLMNHEVVESLNPTGFGLSPLAHISSSYYIIEFVVSVEMRREPPVPLLYHINLDSDRAILTVLDGIHVQVYRYCDPEFPQNLLQALSNIKTNVERFSNHRTSTL